jgi:hypothetical protein
MMILPDRDFCENHVEQPPPAVFCRRGRLLYNILIIKEFLESMMGFSQRSQIFLLKTQFFNRKRKAENAISE